MRDVRPSEKKCFACNVTKPQGDFYDKKRTKRMADGSVDSWVSLYARCKKCTDRHNNVVRPKYEQWYKDYRKKNRKTIAKKTKAHYKKCKAEWWRLLSTVHDLNCVDCGYDEHTAALDFHHVGEKMFGIHGVMKATPTPERWELMKAELKSCVVLCSNCHRVRHAKYNFAEKVVPAVMGAMKKKEQT